MRMIGLMPQALAKALNDSNAEATPTYPLREAQIDELRLRFASYREQTFQPGEIVKFNHGMGPMTKDAHEKLVLMFWRMLTAEERRSDSRWMKDLDSSEMQSLCEIDCLIAFNHHVTGALCFAVADTRALHRVES